MRLLTLIVAVIGIIDVDGQFFARTEEGHFYSGNHAKADIAAEKRSLRLKNEEFKKESQSIVTNLAVASQAIEYSIWEERGSLYLDDGVTPIPENENFGKSHVDPRVPLGFGDSLYKQVHFNILLEDGTSPFISDALSNKIKMESVSNPWILIRSIGNLYDSKMRTSDFLTLLNQNEEKLIRVVCESCVSSHKEMFYKRLSPVPANMLEIIESDWKSEGNGFNVDFKLYSTYDDAVQDQNAWMYCGGFDVEDQGFPGTCGPAANVDDQWINMNTKGGQKDVAIFVQNATAPVEEFSSNWETLLEDYYTSNPMEGKKHGLCWHLPSRDSRRACWRACDYGENTNNLGALKLCHNLRKKGQLWKSIEFSIDSEVDEGTESEKKIKETHALGNDHELADLGTF